MRSYAKFFAAVCIFMASLNCAHAKSNSPLYLARGNEDICALNLKNQILPKLNKDGKFEVGIGMQPISIKDISPKDNSAEVDFFLTIEYEIEEKLNDVKCVGSKAEKIWDIFYNPDIEFMSISDPEYVQGYHWLIEKNRFAYMTRVRGHVELNGNFRSFPFDNLLLKIIASPEDSSETVILKPSLWYHKNINNLTSDFSNIKFAGWNLDYAYFERKQSKLADRESLDWDELSLNLKIVRDPTTVFVRTSVPLFILFLITFCSIFLSEEGIFKRNNDRFTETRVQIQVGTLFALFAFSLYIMEVIPETSYLTLGDLNWFTFMLATLLILSSEYIPNYLNILNKSINLKLIFLVFSFLIVAILMAFQITLFLIN
jgi:hypothetical protein